MNSQVTSAHILVRITVNVLSLLAFACAARADIFQWEYIDPAHSIGKRPSTTLAPDGAGVDAVPGANLSSRNLTRAYLIGARLSDATLTGTNLTDADGMSANLTNADLSQANLANALFVRATLTDTDLSQANLTNASFWGATLRNADFSGAEVRGASFVLANGTATGITLTQLYDTASYEARDLTGINLWGNHLGGGDFVGQNLTDVEFTTAALTGANFREATLTNTRFGRAALMDADFQEAILANTVFYGANLTGATFAGGDLSSAFFGGTTLTDADFANADVRGADLSFSNFTLAQLYSTASYQAHDLTSIILAGGDLSGGNLVGQDLTNADFSGATLTDADFTGAKVRGARFIVQYEYNTSTYVGGFTLAQLYTTASYQARDLTEIGFARNDLAGANFAGLNLTRAGFSGARLTDADFREATLANANFYTATLTGANFRDASLTNADFQSATLTDADFTNAEVRGASFRSTTQSGFTATQFYSTASYQAQDLSGIGLGENDLTGWNFAGQNLTNAVFGARYLSSESYAPLSDADLTGADARGAQYFRVLASTTSANLIFPDGHIRGLDLDAGGQLVVRDYNGNSRYQPALPPIPITISEHFAMGPGGTLRMIFEADAWDSTISFAPGIPVTLGGTLEFIFADDVNLASQLGRTLQVFDWSGVSPTGTFAIASPYRWDTSHLYTTGAVTLTSVSEPAGLTLAAVALLVIMPRRGHRSSALMNQAACRRTKIVALTLAVALQQASSHAAPVRTVALSGQPAPGTPEGVNYSSFGAHFLTAIARQVYRGPVINNAGQVAFRADLTGTGIDATNNQGVWSEGAGSLAMVARTGDVAPGLPDGVNFGRNYALELFEPVLNNAGQTAFYGGLTDGTVGLWSEGSGNLALVARDGTPAPGAPDGVSLSFAVLRDFFPGLPKLNDAGQIAFVANVTGEGVDNTNDWGMWSERPGGLGLVARSGNSAPGTPDGVNFDSFFFQSGFNNAGHSAFYAFVTGDGVDPTNDQGIWSEGSGDLVLVARTGTPAPGTPSGVNFSQFIFATVAFNSTGRTTFKGFLTGEGVVDSNDEGIWSESSGTLALVARRGSPAPGTPSGVNFDEFAVRPALSDAGQSAFSATLTGTGVTSANNQGIWLGDEEDLTLVARTGNQAPGAPAGVRFSNLGRQTVNSAGQIAFRAGLTGTGVGSANNLGIWATDQDGALQLIVRTGSQLEIAPGVFRTTSDLGIALDSGNSDGRASAFNDLGQLVFWASFTNGAQGVFVSDLVKVPDSQPGDVDGDGDVDGQDFLAWQRGESPDPLSAGDLAEWRDNFGKAADPLVGAVTVPEPHTLSILTLAVVAFCRRRKLHVRTGVVVYTVGASITLAWTMSVPVQAAMIGLDSSAESKAVVPFKSDDLLKARANFVSGRVPTHVKGPVHGGTNINTLVGADRFYNQGYTGTNAVIASIEGGHIWNGHETLTHVQQIQNHPSAPNEFDRHATAVGSVLGGRQGGANPGSYQQGMAPDAQLFSGTFVSQWTGTRPSAVYGTISDPVLYDQYRRAFSTGVDETGRTADVINSSWGSDAGSNGSHNWSIGLDGLANSNPSTLFVIIAGNDGPGPNMVFSPASGYNNMVVAALGPNPPYDRLASFSSGGPNNYSDPVSGTKNNARQVVDIAAPGENLAAAYYGGETGGNGATNNPSVPDSGPTGLPYGPIGGPDYYTRGDIRGTSFAAPTVAGGAALLYDAAYSVFPSNDDARDARVMKAVLMNSADKTIGWNNGQSLHSNGLGGVATTQGLDNRVGTGRLNLTTAFDQFLSGTTDVSDILSGNLGIVDNIGWDFGQIVEGVTNDYFFDAPFDAGSTFTATLTWFRDRTISASNSVFDASYDNLNLELWSVVDGSIDSLISESSSLYNNSEHFSFVLPEAGDYALRVRWQGEIFDRVADLNQELYGLAWWAGAGLQAVAVPEPNTFLLLPFALAVMLLRRGTGPLRSVGVSQVVVSSWSRRRIAVPTSRGEPETSRNRPSAFLLPT